jgi:hypothetical protein
MALLGAGCARCGQPYAAQGIRVLAQREEIAFVQLVCFACQTQTLALVTGASGAAPDDQDYPVESLEDAAQPEAPPISEVEVLQMRSFLASYEGDMLGLFEAAREGDDPEADLPG